RIRGDVKFSGTATLVLFDSDGFEDRQMDLVLSSSTGDEDAIAQQRVSVAAMIADLTLAAGNLVETQGYFEPNRFGGARYQIRPAGTGTPDGYLYIQLGNGLQAELLDLENNRNFLVAGARGDGGTDDEQAMQAVIDSDPGEVYVPNGFEFVANNLTIPHNIAFVGGGSMIQRTGAAGDFLQITSVAVTDVYFRGVTLDCNQPNTINTNATVGWRIAAA
ncbi:MAG: glycosyl hydrolase family 28-related protein, partial [Pseudohongiellaceae bacterium]